MATSSTSLEVLGTSPNSSSPKTNLKSPPPSIHQLPKDQNSPTTEFWDSLGVSNPESKSPHSLLPNDDDILTKIILNEVKDTSFFSDRAALYVRLTDEGHRLRYVILGYDPTVHGLLGFEEPPHILSMGYSSQGGLAAKLANAIYQQNLTRGTTGFKLYSPRTTNRNKKIGETLAVLGKEISELLRENKIHERKERQHNVRINVYLQGETPYYQIVTPTTTYTLKHLSDGVNQISKDVIRSGLADYNLHIVLFLPKSNNPPTPGVKSPESMWNENLSRELRKNYIQH